MSSGTPWSVKGIDPRARAVAKTAARKEGMTLGEWLNRVILDDGETDPWDGALTGYPGFSGNDDNAALNAVVERLTDRLEAAERRSTQALSGVDQSVLALTRRLDALEERGEDGGEALEAALSRTRGQQDDLLDRVRKLERSGRLGDGDRPALKALESTMGKLAGRLYETERDVRAELNNLAHKEEQRRDTAEKSTRKLASGSTRLNAA
jgi:localization factor PodJL